MSSHTHLRRSRILASSAALAAARLALPLHAETSPNLLLNSGAELGSIAGWTVSGSSNPGVDNGSFDPGINPIEGSWDFYGGSGPAGTLSQSLNLLGFAPTPQQINNGQVTFNFSYDERSLPITLGTPDGADVSLTSSGGSNPINFTTLEDQSTSAWKPESFSGAIPAGTQSLSYTMNFIRHSGTDLDSFIDANVLTLIYPGSSWKGSSSGAWSNSALWNSGVPAAGAPAMFTSPSNSITASFDGNYPANAPLSELYLDALGGVATLNQSTSTMSADTEYIGNTANGTYNQSGGTNNMSSLYLAYFAGGRGNYSLSGGQLSGGSIHIGYGGGATFSISNGTVTTLSTVVGEQSGSVGNLTITGGAFNTINLSTNNLGSATIALSGGSLNVSGNLTLATSAQLTFSNGNLSVANLNLSGSLSHFHWTGGTLTFTNTLAIDNTGPLTNNASVPQNATLIVDGLATIGNASNANLAVTGKTAFNTLYAGPTPGFNGAINVLSGANFNASDLFLGGTAAGNAGAGQLNVNAGFASVNSLIIWPNGSVSLTGGFLTVSSISLRGGLFQWTGGVLEFATDQTIDSSFFLKSSVDITANRTLAFFNTLNNNGSVTIEPLAGLFAGTLNNGFHGVLTTNGSLAITGSDTSTNIGSLTINGLFSMSGNLANYANLTITGQQSWSATSTFTNAAGNATFNSPAKLAGFLINGGTVELGPTGKLVVEATPATKATLSSTFRTYISSQSLTSSFAPNMTIAFLDNAIAQFTLFGSLPVDSNSLLLAPELLGDANVDGHVDITDLSTVLNHFGATTGAWTSGNFDGATIDLTDLAYVLNNFGLSNPNASSQDSELTTQDSHLAPTPEPTSLAIPLAAPALFLCRRSMRTRIAAH